MPRPKPTKYNVQQDKFVRMEARGESRADILMEVFGIDVATATENEIHNADCKMSRWRKFPCYEETWKDEVRRLSYGMTSKALKKIKQQIDADNDWLANKAANDALTFGKQQIYGDDDKTVSVQISGLPDLGSPDQADDDV